MIKKTTFLLLITLSSISVVKAASDSVSVDTINNYSGWGWDEILVVRNNFITLGIVPQIGGRVLQYDLGIDTFMIINEPLLGDVFPAGSSGPWATTWGYGGYKTWPAPQSVWNWPPPPVMDWGAYEYEVFTDSGDSAVIWLKGQTETTRTPGLRFDRYLTVYRNSTCVKVSTVLYNENTAAQNWGVWDVTQTIVRHTPDDDFSNISVYFPVTAHEDIWYSDDVPARYEVLPGIEKVNYTINEGKIFAAVPSGWVCFVDERDKQTYAKIFDIVEGAEYPDDGGIVQLYTSRDSRYMEVEVTGPVENIGPNGDSIIFTEYWYAGKTDGPLYAASHAGAVKTPLNYSRSSIMATGEYAAFNEGYFQVNYLNGAGEIIAEGPTQIVSPDTFVELELYLALPAGTESIELVAYNVDNMLIGSLDKYTLPTSDLFTAKKASVAPEIDGVGEESCWDSAQWYPLEYVWLPYNDIITPEDFTGRFKISWVSDGLLFLVEVVDDSLFDGHSAPLQNYWDDDCVEIFIDENHSGGNHLNNFNAFAYHVSTTYDVVDNNASGPALFNDHINAARTKNGNTYTWELLMKVFDDTYVENGSSVPVSLTSGKEMGFSMAYCDNDGSASRENFIGSKFLEEAVSNNSYIDATIFGTLSLTGPNDPVGIEQNSSLNVSDVFTIYPVPATSQLFYSFNGYPETDYKITIRSINGQKVYSAEFSKNYKDGSVDISKLDKGLYTFEMLSGNNLITERIIKL